MVKNPPAHTGDEGSIPESGRSPGVGYGNPFQYSCLVNSTREEPGGLYSPWGCKESDRAERLSMHTYTRGIKKVNVQQGQLALTQSRKVTA